MTLAISVSIQASKVTLTAITVETESEGEFKKGIQIPAHEDTSACKAVRGFSSER